MEHGTILYTPVVSGRIGRGHTTENETYPDGERGVDAGRGSRGPRVGGRHASALASGHRQLAQETSLGREAEGSLGGGAAQGDGEAAGGGEHLGCSRCYGKNVRVIGI